MNRTFKSKPVVIEAQQWQGKESEPMEGVFNKQEGSDSTASYVITAQQQVVLLTPGDWVIKEANGVNHYPCAPDIFARRYEAA